MAKAFIAVVVRESDLTIPVAAFARGNGRPMREQVRAKLMQLQQGALDRTSGPMQSLENLLITLKSAAAQQQAFANYPAA